MEKKKCTKCETLKLFSEFYKNKASKDGYQNQCKSCIEKYRKENPSIKKSLQKYYQSNKNKIKERSSNYYYQNQERIKKYWASCKENNREKILEYQREYQRKYRKKKKLEPPSSVDTNQNS